MIKEYVAPCNWWCVLTSDCKEYVWRKYGYLIEGDSPTNEDILRVYKAGTNDGYDFELRRLGRHHVPSNDVKYNL